jgi:ATP-dependent HslUV protease subunit HslV
MESLHATTIPSVREGDRVVPGGDGQVTLGNTVVRATQKIVRPAPVYQARFSDTSR